MNRSLYFLIVLAGSAFFLGAAYWLYQGWQERVRLGLKSLDWPTTPAVFENEYVSFEGSVAQKNKRANYVIVTGYRYEVEGVSHYHNVRSATTIAYASREEAESLLPLCEPGLIDKTRYLVPGGPHQFEVDVFRGGNEGLIIAEIELQSEDEPFLRPDWLGEEVTSDPRYFNSALVKRPYRGW